MKCMTGSKEKGRSPKRPFILLHLGQKAKSIVVFDVFAQFIRCRRDLYVQAAQYIRISMLTVAQPRKRVAERSFGPAQDG